MRNQESRGDVTLKWRVFGVLVLLWLSSNINVDVLLVRCNMVVAGEGWTVSDEDGAAYHEETRDPERSCLSPEEVCTSNDDDDKNDGRDDKYNDENDVDNFLWASEMGGHAYMSLGDSWSCGGTHDVMMSVWIRLQSHYMASSAERFVVGTKCKDCPACGLTLLLVPKEEAQDEYRLTLQYNQHQLTAASGSSRRRHSLLASTRVVGGKGTVAEEDWTQVGLSIFAIGDDGVGEMVQLFVNGRVVAEYYEEARMRLRSPPYSVETLYLGEDVSNNKPQWTSLDGHVATLGLWQQQQLFRRSDGDDLVHATMRQAYECGRSRQQCEKQITTYRPAHFYMLNGQRDALSHAVSKLRDEVGTAHGTIRRLVPLLDSLERRRNTAGPMPYEHYTDGTFVAPPLDDHRQRETDQLARSRRTHVRNAMMHVWEGYRTYAWGMDELKPVGRNGINNMGGMGTTLVDSLSTLWIMNLTDEFYEARDWVRDSLSYEGVGAVSVFETTIRNLAGLLSAHDVSGDVCFLTKAEELAVRLLKAFDTSSGLPYGETMLDGNRSFNTPWHANSAILSEIGTLQVEFRHLANVTHKAAYAHGVNHILTILESMKPSTGLYPLFIRNLSPQASFDSSKETKVSMGAMGDSFYEYLLKVWLQGGPQETRLRNLYDESMTGVHEILLSQSHPSGLYFVGEMVGKRVGTKMDHLSCFLGGTLVLGAYTHPLGLNSTSAQRDLQTGKALAYTCYQMYARSKSGIAPEAVNFRVASNNKISSKQDDFVAASRADYYILRPETAETLFVLFHLTGDNVYREWGWDIFLAIEEACKTQVGYASLFHVEAQAAQQWDKMESFFLAETLKYLYLLQDPDHEIDLLNTHIFNTEAHPLRMLHKR